MRFMTLSFLILCTIGGAFAQTEAPCEDESALSSIVAVGRAVEGGAGGCPNRKKLKSLCLMIGNKISDFEGGPNKYMYQTKFLEAACVDIKKDSEAVKYEKIQKAWIASENDIKCNSTRFDVRDGNILKFAVSNDFDDFITDVINWKVNLNRVDPTDGNTVLDYIKKHMEINKGNSLGQKYQIYYERLKKAGAKHKSELGI
jgi:hypothetical protein